MLSLDTVIADINDSISKLRITIAFGRNEVVAVGVAGVSQRVLSSE